MHPYTLGFSREASFARAYEMRLLNVTTLEFAEFYTFSGRPKYAIASHRWINGSEAKYREVQMKENTEGLGYRKVVAFVEYIKTYLPSIEWLWIDTCCIDKDSTAELSEAINLMFEWYREAEVCLAYLADVTSAKDQGSFRRSEWFQRGWTLQELLASRVVLFLTESWNLIGNKGASTHSCPKPYVGRSLEQEIADITRVPIAVLRDYKASASLTTGDKLRWMEGRRTTREEDMSYALLGIFDVSLVVNYGERDKARQRLLAALRERENLAAEQVKRFEEISKWLSAPNPWLDHRAARKHHEPNTGAWLLKSQWYKAWKSGSSPHRHLWVHGKAGSGKTVLCSTAVEDIKAHYIQCGNAAQVVFYFSFSDRSKQTYDNLMHSMIEQLGRKQPGLSLLHRAWENCEGVLGLDESRRILSACVAPYNTVFLHVDALDECSLDSETRLDVLASLEDLLRDSPNIRMLATSRHIPKIRHFMAKLDVVEIPIDVKSTDSDIQRYVSTQLSRDCQLSQLDDTMKKTIEKTFVLRANGMYEVIV